MSDSLIVRVGSYGILSNSNMYGVVMIPDFVTKQLKVALLGGGIDDGEELDVALKREIDEEVGCECIIGDYLGESVEKFWSSRYRTTIISKQHYFDVKLGPPNNKKIEENHELVWGDKSELLSKKWFYLSQKDAINGKFGNYNL